tara:strand:+ start:95 stop:358 length:264 start_codon:yes stop_codon:yes gene_type:complete
MYGKIVGKTYLKREHERTKLKLAGGSWSLNMDELTDNVEDIVFTTSKGKYKITYKKAKEKGFYRVFQGETKLIVPQKEWEFFNESNR